MNYKNHMFFFADIDECYLNPCEHKCVNTIGSYYCASEDRQDPDTNKHT